MTPTPLLSVRNLSIRFGAYQALDDVAFDVAPGELLALIGPNGAGKTTLINALTGALAPDTGEIVLAGAPITGLPPHAVARRGFARTFQAAEPFDTLSVRDNVIVGAVPASSLTFAGSLLGRWFNGRTVGKLREAADRHLAAVGLLDKADLPASLLTAGQRRLLSIARILATGADFLLLDEPGAGLNETEKHFLGDVILALSKEGKTIVFVDHDMPLVSRIARRIMVLDRGRLIADGTPEAVRADEKVLEAYLGKHEPPAPEPQVAAPPRSAPEAPARPDLLTVEGLHVAYGGLVALDDVSLRIGEGEVVSLVGANGAGKSSLLRAIARMEPCRAATMTFAGEDLRTLPVDKAVARGVSLVPEGRALFGSLTVAENLAAGRYAARRTKGFAHVLWRTAEEHATHDRLLAMVYELFPPLAERRHQLAGTLSGGQGQMLAIGRALMADPRLLMLDEPSLGLAPQIVDEIFTSIEGLSRRGLTVLLVEQNVTAALEACDRGYVLANGRIVASGTGRELLRDTDITEAYLGSSAGADEAAPRAAAE